MLILYKEANKLNAGVRINTVFQFQNPILLLISKGKTLQLYLKNITYS